MTFCLMWSVKTLVWSSWRSRPCCWGYGNSTLFYSTCFYLVAWPYGDFWDNCGFSDDDDSLVAADIWQCCRTMCLQNRLPLHLFYQETHQKKIQKLQTTNSFPVVECTSGDSLQTGLWLQLAETFFPSSGMRGLLAESFILTSKQLTGSLWSPVQP